MTRDEPRHRLAKMRSTTPSAQLSPLTRNIAEAAAAPDQANAANNRTGLGERSARAPMKIRTIAGEDGGERQDVEHQGPGVHRYPDHLQVGMAGHVAGQGGAGRLLGDDGQVRSHQDGQGRRDVRRVGPVVPVPGLLVRGVPGASGLDRGVDGARHGRSLPQGEPISADESTLLVRELPVPGLGQHS